MEEESQKIIYIDKDEDITDIVDKIKNASSRLVTLVVPKEAIVLQDVINLKILQKKAEEFGKEVSVSKTDSDKIPASFQGEETAHRISGLRKKNPKISGNHLGSVKVSDMVHKGGTIDLRNMSSSKSLERHKEPGLMKYEQVLEDSENFYREEEKEGHDVLHVETDSVPIKVENIHSDENFWGEKEDVKEVPSIESRLPSFFESPREELEENDIANYSRVKVKDKRRRSVLPTLSSRFFAIFILFCLLTAGISLFFVLPKADIFITLKAENVKGDFNFVLGKNTSLVDQEKNQIPAQNVEVVSEKSQTYKANSKKNLSEKASGEIVIYNECSTGTQTLVANTRFLSKEGKVFKVEEGVTIPGFTKPEDTVVPGQKKVKVVAEEAGESYNIGATSFTIPKLQELVSWKYSCLYARSDSSMSGGIEKEVTYVSESDYNTAKAALVKLVQEENGQKITEKQNDSTFVVNDDSDEGQISAKSSVAVGGVAEEFVLTVSVKKSILVVEKGNINSLVEKNIIKLANSGDASPVEGSLSYEVKDFDEKNDEVSITVSASEDFVFNINDDEIKEAVANKNEAEFSEYFNKIDGVESVNINLWPFWVKKVPNDHNKINVTIDISDSI
jgi:hypothetical protein